jgi:CRISPR/Cas system Type II protein with McrA/HNH and RuvC-like nuclease domain
MPKDLSREIRKLKVRLEDYLKEEQEFVKQLRKCLSNFTELNNTLERSKMSNEDMGKLTRLRLEAVKALSEALKREGVAEHERSHLLESYGALILSLEEEFGELK